MTDISNHDALLACMKDALTNLSKAHELMNTNFLSDLAIAEGMQDIDQRHQHVSQAKEHLENGYKLAFEAYHAETAACKTQFGHT